MRPVAQKRGNSSTKKVDLTWFKHQAWWFYRPQFLDLTAKGMDFTLPIYGFNYQHILSSINL
jgi:hypothetical protein